MSARRPQNPDPNAAKYFASHISKAYAALTDEVSRKNYEKYGHPDGPQVGGRAAGGLGVRASAGACARGGQRARSAAGRGAGRQKHEPPPLRRLRPQGMNMGVALPSWMFNKDKKAAPIMLLGLVGGGILLPLAIVSYYMLKVCGCLGVLARGVSVRVEGGLLVRGCAGRGHVQCIHRWRAAVAWMSNPEACGKAHTCCPGLPPRGQQMKRPSGPHPTPARRGTPTWAQTASTSTPLHATP